MKWIWLVILLAVSVEGQIWNPGAQSIGGYGGVTQPSGCVDCPVIRGSSGAIAFASASSLTIPIPSGTVAGDLAIVQVSQGQTAAGVTSGGGAWTQIYNDAGPPYIGGAAYSRVLTSGDLSGSITASFVGSDAGAAALTTFVGSRTVATNYHDQLGGGTSPGWTSPLNGPSMTLSAPSVVLCFGGVRLYSSGGQSLQTVTPGTLIGAQAYDGVQFSAALFSETFTASGTSTPVWDYTAEGNGYTISQVVIQ